MKIAIDVAEYGTLTVERLKNVGPDRKDNLEVTYRDDETEHSVTFEMSPAEIDELVDAFSIMKNRGLR